MSVFSPLDEGYIELEDTYICKDYGFASVMRWLGTWHASQNSATDKVRRLNLSGGCKAKFLLTPRRQVSGLKKAFRIQNLILEKVKYMFQMHLRMFKNNYKAGKTRFLKYKEKNFNEGRVTRY